MFPRSLLRPPPSAIGFAHTGNTRRIRSRGISHPQMPSLAAPPTKTPASFLEPFRQAPSTATVAESWWPWSPSPASCPPPRTALRDPPQHIRPAKPLAIPQCALRDHLYASLHQSRRLRQQSRFFSAMDMAEVFNPDTLVA